MIIDFASPLQLPFLLPIFPDINFVAFCAAGIGQGAAAAAVPGAVGTVGEAPHAG